MAQVPNAEQELSALAARLFRPYSSVVEQQEPPPAADGPATEERSREPFANDERPLLYWSAYYSLPDYFSDTPTSSTATPSESFLSVLHRTLLRGAENVQLVGGVRATQFSADYAVDEVLYSCTHHNALHFR